MNDYMSVGNDEDGEDEDPDAEDADEDQEGDEESSGWDELPVFGARGIAETREKMSSIICLYAVVYISYISFDLFVRPPSQNRQNGVRGRKLSHK